MSPPVDRDTMIGAGLAFVAGFVDAAAFIALTGLFTAHVTGNVVLLGAELVTSATGLLARFLALPVFMVTVALTRLFARALERRGAKLFRPLLALEAVTLATFALAGAALTPLGAPDGVRAVSVGMLGVAAMGVQNGIGRIVLGRLAATTVMTGNLTQAVIDLTDRWRGGSLSQPQRTRLRGTLGAVSSFALGALMGAFGVAAFSFWSMWLPILVLLGLLTGPDPQN